MEDDRDLERLVVETTLRNCQRKLLYCDPSERDLLWAIFNEARRELAEMDESALLAPAQECGHPL